MAEWGRKGILEKWPSRTPVWTWLAIFASFVFSAGMLTLVYERSWSAAERLYRKRSVMQHPTLTHLAWDSYLMGANSGTQVNTSYPVTVAGEVIAITNNIQYGPNGPTSLQYGNRTEVMRLRP